MKNRFYIVFISLLTLFSISSNSFAYVDIERATYWHFLLSRWGQTYAPPIGYKLGTKGIDIGSKFIQSEKVKTILSGKYTKEFAPHLAWRLGCNIGWEVAGAALMIHDHRSVNLSTIMEDSALTPGLLLYPFGQVIGQSMGGDAMLSILNRYTKEKMLNSTLSWLLVEEAGVPQVWGPATLQKAASRFFGLALGTYLAWSLFDLGHNLIYQKQPWQNAFSWSRYKILAMAGFTYGGYLGHNVGFTLSNKKLLPYTFGTKLYSRLAEKAQSYVLKIEPELENLSKLSPKRFLYRSAKGILNRDVLLWRGSQYIAMPVNALFCFILSQVLPAGLKAIEEWLTIKEWNDLEEPQDSYQIYSAKPDDKSKLEFVDDTLSKVNEGMDMAISALADSLKTVADTNSAKSQETSDSIDKLASNLKESKGILFDLSLIMAANQNAVLEIAHKKIDDIKTSEDLTNFVSNELLPIYSLEDYETVFADQAQELLNKSNSPDSIANIKTNLHALVQFTLPEIYLGKVTKNIQTLAQIPELNMDKNP